MTLKVWRARQVSCRGSTPVVAMVVAQDIWRATTLSERYIGWKEPEWRLVKDRVASAAVRFGEGAYLANVPEPKVYADYRRLSPAPSLPAPMALPKSHAGCKVWSGAYYMPGSEKGEYVVVARSEKRVVDLLRKCVGRGPSLSDVRRYWSRTSNQLALSFLPMGEAVYRAKKDWPQVPEDYKKLVARDEAPGPGPKKSPSMKEMERLVAKAVANARRTLDALHALGAATSRASRQAAIRRCEEASDEHREIIRKISEVPDGWIGRFSLAYRTALKEMTR